MVMGGDIDYITGLGLGVGVKVWEWNRAMGMGMNFDRCFEQYHMRICSIIRELAKPSHLNFTLAKPSPEHVINSYHTLDVLCSE